MRVEFFFSKVVWLSGLRENVLKRSGADRLPFLSVVVRSKSIIIIPFPSFLSYHLVHPARAQARANGVGHGLGGLDVGDADVGLADVVPVEEREEREEIDDGG